MASLVLTPERVGAVYDCLRFFVPFTRMKLPPADEIAFHITRHNDRQAHYTCLKRAREGHEIAVSDFWQWTFSNLQKVVAHEMIHLYQSLRETDSPITQHNAEFRVLSERVCKHFNWNVATFIDPAWEEYQPRKR